MKHIPVLQKEVIECLDPKPNENFIDATIGEGGHGLAILEAIKPNGKLLGIDWDPENIRRLESGNRIILVNDNFANLKKIVLEKKFKNVAGILFDLGMSSRHLEESGRGFSFLRDEPLDMRYKGESPDSEIKIPRLTAEKIINYGSFQEIEMILREYGEERFSKSIARKIIEERKFKPIKATFQLVSIIKKAVPLRYQRQRLHCATRSFQALRIAVNKELDNLQAVLPQALEILSAGGRLAVVSFHSLEDRIVKKNFYDLSKSRNGETAKLRVLTKKPITPGLKEIKINPRSRSAKLRAAIKK